MAHCRSPSPSHGRFQSLSNSRTPEPASDRRLNATTPVPFPSLKHHRVRSSFELAKENEHESLSPADIAMIRPKSSPTASAAASAATKGGVKSFMAPTISASSKAVTPSPRRKVLGERNQHDGVRSSVDSLRSSVESIGSLASVMLAKPVVQEELEKASRRPDEAVHAPVGVDQAVNDPDDPLTPATIAPLDADPSLPPYDPETNFLSPRPRFLFYKPKPQQEMQQLEGEDQLLVDGASEKSGEEDAGASWEEDAGASENSEVARSLDLADSFEEDKEAAGEKPGEATVSSDSKSDVAHAPQEAAKTQKSEEAEDDLSDKPEEEEEAYVPDDPPFHAPAADDDSSSQFSVQPDVNESLFPELTKPHPVVHPPAPKPRSFFFRPEVLALVIITLVMACFTIPMIDTPVITSSVPSLVPLHSRASRVFEHLHVEGPFLRAAEFADTNLRELSSLLHHWSANAYAHLQKWASFTAKEEAGWVLPSNFTSPVFPEGDMDLLQGDMERESINDSSEESEDIGKGIGVSEYSSGVVGEDKEESSAAENQLSGTEEADDEVAVVNDESPINSGDEHVKAGVEEVVQSENSLEPHGQVDDTISWEVKEEAGEFQGEGTTDFTSPNYNGGEQGGAAFPGDTEFHPDQIPESPVGVQDARDSSDRLGSTEEVQEHPSSDTPADLVNPLTEDGSNRQIAVAVSSVVIALVAILLSVYFIKQKRFPSVAPAAAPVPSKDAGTTSRIPEQSPLPEPLLERAELETTMQVESGPSEASSSVLMQQSAATLLSEFNLSKRVAGGGEEEENIASQERRTARRDSTASSTSFGSFTTYEKVSGKKGKSSKSKDEAMTPVRRSSRIRSQVSTSQES